MPIPKNKWLKLWLSCSSILGMTCLLGQSGLKVAAKIPPTTTNIVTPKSLPKDLYFTALKENSLREISSHYQDSKGYLWFTSSVGLGRYDGQHLKTYKSNPLDTNSLSTSNTLFMTEDSRGQYWISTGGGGLNAFDPKTETFRHFRHDPTDPTTISSNAPQQLLFDKEGRLWIGFNDASYGLNVFNPKTGKSKRFKIQKGKSGALQGSIKGSIIEVDNRVYLGSTAGLEYYDKSSGLFHHFPLLNENKDTITKKDYLLVNDNKEIINSRQYIALCESQDGKIYIGRPNGISAYDPATNQIKALQLTTTDGRKMDSAPLEIIEDDAGHLWFSTRTTIWSLSTNRQTLIKHNYKALETRQLINFKNQTREERGLFKDKSGTIWFGKRYYDPRRVLMEYHQIFSPKTKQPLFHTLIRFGDEHCVFCQTEAGLFMYDLKAQAAIPLKVVPHSPKPNNYLIEEHERLKESVCASYLSNFLNRQSRLKLFKDGQIYPFAGMGYLFDAQGNLWSPTAGQGLIRVKKEVFEAAKWNKGRWEVHEFDQWLPDDPEPVVPTNILLGIMEDSQSNLWLAASHGGMIKVDPANLTFKQYDYEQGKNGIASSRTLRMVEDNKENLWITTGAGGLNKFNLNTEEFTYYNEENGLHDPNVFVLQIDKDGWIWFNSDTGLSSFNPETEEFTYYNQNDGLLDWQTNFVINKELNWMFLPGNTGFHVFNLDDLKNRPTQQSIIRINEVATFDPNENKLQTRLPIDWKNNTLALSYQENSLAIQFAILDFRNPVKHEYQYALNQGGEPNWIDLGNQTELNLNQLEAGTYYFHLKACNSDKIWTTLEQPLQFTIHPPFWQSNMAYVLYLLAFLGMLYAIYRFNLSRQLEKVEAQQLKALDQLKTRFFTNITHEFRTPLTVILGMAAQKNHPQAMHLIQRNGQKLLQLINQLLDLSKLDTGNLKAEYQQIEIVSYTQYIGESFQSLADKKHLRLTIYSEIKELWLDMDEEKYRQIISNLLSNAIKFTSESGRIVLHLFEKDKELSIKIKDNGIGIAEKELPHIFDRFYQVENSASKVGKGTGIGLALVKELVDLLEGTIVVKSEVGKQTTFELQFPIRQTATTRLNQFEPLQVETSLIETAPILSNLNGSQELPKLLLIEDNSDVVTYIQSILQSQYDLLLAENGEIGIFKAIEHIPDLIISDVMMPKKNGFEVVNTLKQDERTSHIPIVLLTAKATHQDKLAGLQRGADAYLMKPFDKTELVLRLKNLLSLRQQLQLKYADRPVSKIFQQKEKTLDDLFLEKLQAVLDQLYQEATVDIHQIANALELSYTQFNRKLKALTNQTPAKYLRQFRLEKAKTLLQDPQNELNISEVAYQVGFTDPNYFTRSFKELFGTAPNAVRQQE